MSSVLDDKLAEEQLTKGETEAAQSNAFFDGAIADAGEYFQDQIDATKDWEKTQKELQNEQTDFAIEQIEQQKAQAHKDYIKEQSGAYKDWQKQSNAYGANAEVMAANGLTNSGFSESSQVSMYNTYQNRVATARETFMRAALNYDNAMKDARLQNNSALAQIAYESLAKQLELALQGFQYENTLILEKQKAAREIKSNAWSRYKDVLNQINTENALAEQKRQHDEQMSFQREQFNWQKAQASKSSSGSGGGSGSVKKSSGSKSSSGSSKVSPTAFKGTTYKEAVEYMEKYGGGDVADGLMTSGEWTRRKASYNRYGQGNSAVKNYDSYADYLKDYVAYACGGADITIGTSDGTGRI